MFLSAPSRIGSLARTARGQRRKETGSHPSPEADVSDSENLTYHFRVSRNRQPTSPTHSKSVG